MPTNTDELTIHCKYDELINPKDLKPHPDNANSHPDDQITRLAKILQYQGWRYPVKVSKQTGFITSGHGRVLAAKEIGLKAVPVNYQDYTDEDQERADLHADNAIASWADLDLSRIDLQVPNFDPSFDIDLLGIKGFTIDASEKAEIEDDIPESVPATTKTGDLYIMGDHRLLCGDSTKIEDAERLMNGDKADMMFASPPYNAGKKGFEEGKSKYQSDEDNDESKWLSLMGSMTAIALDACEYVFINVQWLFSNKVGFLEWLYDYRDHLIQDIVWCKTNMPSINAQYLNSNHEYVFVFRKDSKNRKIEMGKPFHGSISSWFEQNRAINRDYAHIHRATFNVSLPEKFIEDFGPNSVLDLFGGTGSTLIACEKTKRKCFMMEIDPHYCDVIVARWEKYSGKRAILHGQG